MVHYALEHSKNVDRQYHIRQIHERMYTNEEEEERKFKKKTKQHLNILRLDYR